MLLSGTARFIETLFDFIAPLIPVFPLIYWNASKPLPADRGGAADRAWLRACAIAMVVAGAAMWVGALVTGAAELNQRWMYPVLMPLPLWLFLRVKLSGATDRANRIFLIVAAVFALAAVIARPAVYFTGASHCRRCRDYWPMASYAQSLHRSGFYQGTIVAPSLDLGGNLRYVMPDSRIVVSGYPPSVFGQSEGGQCLIVWRGKTDMPGDEAAYVRDALGAKIGPDAVRGNVLAPLLTNAGRFDTLNYVLLPAGGGLCR